MNIIFDTAANTPKIDGRFKIHFKSYSDYPEKYDCVKYHLVINNKVVGHALIFICDCKTEIIVYCIEIFQPFRSKGYGFILMKEIEKWSIDNKIKCINLTVERDNDDAYNLYKKSGFDIDSYDNLFFEMYKWI